MFSLQFLRRPAQLFQCFLSMLLGFFFQTQLPTVLFTLRSKNFPGEQPLNFFFRAPEVYAVRVGKLGIVGCSCSGSCSWKLTLLGIAMNKTITVGTGTLRFWFSLVLVKGGGLPMLARLGFCSFAQVSPRNFTIATCDCNMQLERPERWHGRTCAHFPTPIARGGHIRAVNLSSRCFVAFRASRMQISFGALITSNQNCNYIHNYHNPWRKLHKNKRCITLGRVKLLTQVKIELKILCVVHKWWNEISQRLQSSFVI